MNKQAHERTYLWVSYSVIKISASHSVQSITILGFPPELTPLPPEEDEEPPMFEELEELPFPELGDPLDLTRGDPGWGEEELLARTNGDKDADEAIERSWHWYESIVMAMDNCGNV